MEIDFRKYKDIDDYTPLPEDSYLSQIVSAQETTTKKSGTENWKVKFEVLTGEFRGRFIFDNFVLTEKALPRLKKLCSAIGMDVSRKVNVKPADLLDKKCLVDVIIETYDDDEGNEKTRNKVKFAGFRRANAADIDEIGRCPAKDSDISHADVNEGSGDDNAFPF